MRRAMMGLGVLACLGVLASDAPVRSCGYGMPSPLARFLAADCVVAGRVVGFEDQNINVLPFPTAQKDEEYKVAIVRVLHALKGAEGQEHVRVGTTRHQQLRNGQEVLLFLAEHFEEPFYLMRQEYEYAITGEGNNAFAGQVAQYRRWSRLWNDPVAGLKSASDEDRLHTAALLMTHLRTFRPQAHHADRRLAPIDARLSKLILEAMANSDWSKGGADFRTSPRQVFSMVRATAKDGWNPQGLKNQQEIETAARRWLRDNAGTFRIQAFVEKG
ncbi:MAG: hypothetical protein L0Z62_44630 [Gemmataceae bacterium]|nr:hypothetical protein [Gemmataceae bacterium]